MQTTIKIEESLCTLIQSVYYEIQMKQENIQKIIMDYDLYGKSIKDSKALQEYEQQLVELKIKYDALLDGIKNTILAPLIGHAYNFSLDFRTNTINLSINCPCGEKIYQEQMQNNTLQG